MTIQNATQVTTTTGATAVIPTRTVNYNGQSFQFPTDVNSTGALEALKIMFPELAKGGVKENADGSFTAYVVAQNKADGTRTVNYNGQSFQFPTDVTSAAALEALKVMFPELSKGGVKENADGSYTAYVVAQNKAATRTVNYNGQSFQFPDDVSSAAALEALKVMFPELSKGGVKENADGSYTAYVVAQNKAATRTVAYNGQSFQFPEDVTSAAALEALKVMFPELSKGGVKEHADGSYTAYVVAQNKAVEAQ